MGIGQMTIPLYLSALPEGMTLTIDEIVKNEPAGFWTHISQPNEVPSFPHQFSASDIAAGQPSNKRGAKIAELCLRTGGATGLGGGQGGSFLLKFTLRGRPDAHPDARELRDVKGTLTVGTSAWGFFSRPDQTTFAWEIEGGKPNTYTAATPTLGYLDDSCLAVAYVPEEKTYVFGVSNQQDFIVKVMQGGVSGIIAGHKVLWTTAGGMVAAIGGVAVSVVAFGAGALDGMSK
ncbi:hypothetical protein PG985_012893 [Apiospora marii]|uniref:uncharacterized protein n=1 Tax=Apiospora marii TaxID=335849 RepID=UPI00312E49A4